MMASEQPARVQSEFGQAAAWAKRGVPYVHLAGVGTAVLLLVLLGFLQSNIGVWLYVALLTGLIWFGIVQISGAFRATWETTKHLDILSRLIDEEPERDAFLAEVRKLVSNKDLSNAPEALYGLRIGRISPERARVVATSAFSFPLRRIKGIGYIRTALVLLGLFGTVLFFALELRDNFLTGELEGLFSGLRGAMACTLTGITGSLLVGGLAAWLDGRLDGMLLDVEALVSGPVAAIIDSAPERRDLRSEADLWDAVLDQVTAHTTASTRILEKMGSDARVYARTLQEVEQRLTHLPQVEVPVQIAELGHVVAEFREGMVALHETVKILIPALHHLDGDVPARILERLDTITEGQQASGAAMAQSLDSLERRVIAASTSMGEARQEINGLGDRLGKEVGAIGTYATQLTAAVSSMENARGEVAKVAGKQTRQLDRIEAAVAAGAAERTETLQVVEDAGRSMKETSIALTDVLGGLRIVGESLPTSANTLSEAASHVAEAAVRLDTVGQDIGAAAERIGDPSSELGALRKMIDWRFRRLDPLVRWCQDARQAPLIRLLLGLRWPSRRGAANTPLAPG
jgi:hypothetical protein